MVMGFFFNVQYILPIRMVIRIEQICSTAVSAVTLLAETAELRSLILAVFVAFRLDRTSVCVSNNFFQNISLLFVIKQLCNKAPIL